MIPQLNDHATFLLSPEEERLGTTFNVFHKAYMRNLRYQTMQIRDNLPIPTTDEEMRKYFAERALQDGIIHGLTILIDLNPPESSDEVESDGSVG